MTYCGLLCLLMVPQAFIGATRRQRILYGLFLSFIVVPVVFPWFDICFGCFRVATSERFHCSAIFGIITLSMTAFSRYMDASFNLWALGVSLLVLLGVLYFPINEIQAAYR